MYQNVHYHNVDEALPSLLKLVLEGHEVGARGGSRTMEQTMVGTTLVKPWQRENLHPMRKANVAAQIAETMWVLAGRNDIEFLSHYLPRAEQFSDDGEVWRGGYGPRLRSWQWAMSSSGRGTDQLAEVVRLLREDRGTRRAVMSIFDPGADYGDSKDIPCNNWLSFISRMGKLDLHVGIRSNDLMWGWSGINAFEWSVLQEIVAELVGMNVGQIHFSTTSLHLYENHWGKAHAMVDFPPYQTSHLQDSPRFHLPSAHGAWSTQEFDSLVDSWFDLEEMIRTGNTPALGAESVIKAFPEPMMRSWLRVLQWWWTGDKAKLDPLRGTRLHQAALVGVQPERPVADLSAGKLVIKNPSGGTITLEGPPPLSSAPAWTLAISQVMERGDIDTPAGFIEYACALHDEKHAAYGDSWKRRGEMLGILANIARKVDRLGKAETGDETSADTATDLMVYLAKYAAWLRDATSTDDTRTTNNILRLVGSPVNNWSQTEAQASEDLEEFLRTRFDELEGRVNKDEPRFELVDDMLVAAYVLAKRLWEAEIDWKAGNATRLWNPEPVRVQRRVIKDQPQA